MWKRVPVTIFALSLNKNNTPSVTSLSSEINKNVTQITAFNTCNVIPAGVATASYTPVNVSIVVVINLKYSGFKFHFQGRPLLPNF